MHREGGVTLVDLAVTLVVLAICAAIGVPALRAFTQQQRAAAAMSALSTDLAGARMAAITHRRPVVVCPVERASAGCAQGMDWSRGWVVFFDPDGNRRADRADEVIVLEQAPAGGHLRVLTSGGRRQVRYLPDGRSAGSNVTFTLCDADDRLLGKVVVNNAGRVRTERPSGPVPCAGADTEATRLARRDAPV